MRLFFFSSLSFSYSSRISDAVCRLNMAGVGGDGGGGSDVSTVLCSIQRLSELCDRSPGSSPPPPLRLLSSPSATGGAAGGDGGDAATTTATPADVEECLRYDEAVRMALTACEASLPNDRFQLVETPGESFLLVTNVLPKDGEEAAQKRIRRRSPAPSSSLPSSRAFPEVAAAVAAASAAASAAAAEASSSSSSSPSLPAPPAYRSPRSLGDRDAAEIVRLEDDFLDAAAAATAANPPASFPSPSSSFSSARSSRSSSPVFFTRREYAPKGLSGMSYDGAFLGNSYIVYTREQLERSLSLNRRASVDEILKYADAPGLLTHHNVCDVEALLWLFYCGPRSFCQSDTCFGREHESYLAPFPALLPPFFYEPVTDHLTFINLAELYVYVWYKDYDGFKERGAGRDGPALGDDLGPATLQRIRDVLASVRARFDGREIPLWPSSSRTCLFCTLYNQNRLCLDFARNAAASTNYSPVVLKDCRFAVTNVTLSHVLPSSSNVTLFPVYNIGALAASLRRRPTGEAELVFD